MNIETHSWRNFHRHADSEDHLSLAKRVRFDVEQTLKMLYADRKLADLIDELYLPLAQWVAQRTPASGHPLLLGMGGAQGSGKTTLASVLSRILMKGFDLKTIVLSIDDLYKTRAERQKMAQQQHPLFATRGVPGTHDLDLANSILTRLYDLKNGEVMRLPSFDKSIDERRPVRLWQEVEGPVDVVIFEGWCVGVRPQKQPLSTALNALERDLDSDLTWRHAVNDIIKSDYQTLFDRIDLMMWLQAPNYEVVYDWRNKQERVLEAHLYDIHGAGLDKMDLTVMNEVELRHFMQFYERLTRHMLVTMPETADVLLTLDAKQRVMEVRFPQQH